MTSVPRLPSGATDLLHHRHMKREDLIDEFELQDQDGQPVTLSDLVADGPTVLYYFVKAMTPGCTVESTGRCSTLPT